MKFLYLYEVMRLDPEKLIDAREDAGLSQKELAAIKGLSDRTISRIERGLGCHHSTARAIAEALDIPLASLRPTKAKRKH